MDKQLQYRLGMWLAEKKHQPWVRGKNDCCTLFMEWHDIAHGTETLKQIYGKYHDLKTAITWAKKIPLDKWFPEHGYKQVEDLQDGDIVQVQHDRRFSSGYIVFMGFAWGLGDNTSGITRHDLSTNVPHTIWRYANGT